MPSTSPIPRLTPTCTPFLVSPLQTLMFQKVISDWRARLTSSWINGWMGIATAVRAAVPLGLMKNAPGPTMINVMKPGTSLLPPPVGDWDREERRVLMFTILMFDVNASSSSGWPNMMMTDELVSLPRSSGSLTLDECVW